MLAASDLRCCSGLGCSSVPAAFRAGFFSGSGLQRTVVKPVQRTAALSTSARYRGHGTDLSKVDQFKRSEKDSGSTEVQIARLSARVTQLTSHLQQNRKDYASTRGLTKLLGQRRRLMKFLYKNDRPKYDQVITTLGVRPLKIQAGKGVVVRITEESAPIETETVQVTT